MSGEAGLLRLDARLRRESENARLLLARVDRLTTALKDAERERDQAKREIEHHEKNLRYLARKNERLRDGIQRALRLKSTHDFETLGRTVFLISNHQARRVLEEALQEPVQQGAETAAGEAKPT